MVYCTECGSENEEAASYCTRCGAPLKEGLPSAREKDPHDHGECLKPLVTTTENTVFLCVDVVAYF